MRADNATYQGMKIIVDNSLDDQPRMQLTPAFADNMPAEFVAETNAWMAEFFGRVNRTYSISGHTLIMGPKTYRALIEATS